MIPRRIYTSWVGKPNVNIYSENHHKLFMKCFESWRRFLPDYSVTIITRENLFDHGESVMVRDWYARGYFTMNWATPFWLQQQGGIYLDMDVEIMQRFDWLHDEQCFLGRETDGFANAAMVGAVAGHPFLAELLHRLPGCDIEEQNEGGPRLYTRVLRDFGWSGANVTERVSVRGSSVLVLKDDVMYPFLWNEPFETRQSKITPDTVAVHHWASSWNQTAENQVRGDL